MLASVGYLTFIYLRHCYCHSLYFAKFYYICFFFFLIQRKIKATISSGIFKTVIEGSVVLPKTLNKSPVLETLQLNH